MATKDLAGRQFGRWTVLERIPGSGAARWLCRCQCGTRRGVAAKNLISGASTGCGCGGKRGGHAAKDVAGQKFGMLTALYPTRQRGHNGSVLWHCRCDCGNESDISLNRLKYSDVISCGCMRKKCGEEIQEKLIHVAGTSIDAIRSSKVRADNKTGVRGVYLKRGKYCANITFQQKCYYLGCYSSLEDAAKVRKEAEALLHDEALRFYEKWKHLAQRDAVWAAENPVEIRVNKRDSGEFEMEMLPKIDDLAAECAYVKD